VERLTFLEGTVLPPFSDLTSIATHMKGFNQQFTEFYIWLLLLPWLNII